MITKSDIIFDMIEKEKLPKVIIIFLSGVSRNYQYGFFSNLALFKL